MKILIRTLAWIAITAPVMLTAAAADLVVVVNKANATTNISKNDLRKMVLGDKAAWASGDKVSVILRAHGQPERDGALESVCGMNDDEFTRHLMHANFNGDTGAPPKALGSGAAVRALVGSIPGAIGFLLASDVNGSVKAISVDGVAAGAAGYKVQAGK